MDVSPAGTDSPELTPLEGVAARVRAAIAYAALRVPEVAEKADIGEATLRRIISPTSPRGADPAELWRIADACRVPHQWVDLAWMADDQVVTLVEAKYQDAPLRLGRGTPEQRLEVIEHYLAALLTLAARRTDHDDIPLPHETRSPSPPAQPASESDPAQLPKAAGNGVAAKRRSRRAAR